MDLSSTIMVIPTSVSPTESLQSESNHNSYLLSHSQSLSSFSFSAQPTVTISSVVQSTVASRSRNVISSASSITVSHNNSSPSVTIIQNAGNTGSPVTTFIAAAVSSVFVLIAIGLIVMTLLIIVCRKRIKNKREACSVSPRPDDAIVNPTYSTNYIYADDHQPMPNRGERRSERREQESYMSPLSFTVACNVYKFTGSQNPLLSTPYDGTLKTVGNEALYGENVTEGFYSEAVSSHPTSATSLVSDKYNVLYIICKCPMNLNLSLYEYLYWYRICIQLVQMKTLTIHCKESFVFPML